MKEQLKQLVERQIKHHPDFDYEAAMRLINEYDWSNDNTNGSIAFCIEALERDEKLHGGEDPHMLNDRLHCALRYLHGESSLELDYRHPFFSVSKLRTLSKSVRKSR